MRSGTGKSEALSDSEVSPLKSTVQATGQVAHDIVGGLSGSPILLAIVVLNCLGLGVAVWFLNNLLSASNERYLALIKLCFPK